MTSCPDESRLIRLMAGELAEGDAVEIHTHLQLCEGCHKRFRELKATWELLGEWQPPAPQEDLAGRVLAAASRGTPMTRKRWVQLAATVALAVGAGMAAGRLNPARTSVPRQMSVSEDELIDRLGLDVLSGNTVGLASLLDEHEAATQPSAEAQS